MDSLKVYVHVLSKPASLSGNAIVLTDLKCNRLHVSGCVFSLDATSDKKDEEKEDVMNCPNSSSPYHK